MPSVRSPGTSTTPSYSTSMAWSPTPRASTQRVGSRCLTNICRTLPCSGAKHSGPSISRPTTGCVDGKPRFDGVRDFLASRDIHLPEGSLDDPSQAETVCGLGNRKNDLVNKIIEEGGVEPYEGRVKFLGQLRSQAFKIAIVTSSQNCTAVLKAVKLDHFFDVQVDGNTIHAQHLAGKPAPDTFLMAAKLLGVEPSRA